MTPPLHHALVLPFPLQGHISPLLRLSQHLAAAHCFRITFVNTEHNHASLVAKNNTNNQLSNDTCVNMVCLPDGLPFDAERKATDMHLVLESMPKHMMPLLEQLISDTNQSTSASSPCKITCIIADIFLPWAHDLAKRAGVPTFIGFHASSIAQFSFLYHIPLLVSSGQLNPDGTPRDAREKLTGIPGVLGVPPSSAPWLIGDPVRSKETFQGLASVRSYVDQLDCLLFNSFTEIEKETVDALAEETEIKMAPVGPMMLLDNSSITHDQKSNSSVTTRDGLTVHEKECLDWLDGRPKGSVLYVAFGTTAWLTTEDLHALARGIEASQVPFLWVLRSDLLNGSESATGLPKDFLERTKGLAYFTSWAPQTMVLSHPSVGAFLSHGGWNSTLEAMCAGVPMLMWPDFWDQKFHAEQAVEQWQVGLLLRRDGKGVEQQEVERLVRCVMHGKEGEEMRERAAALKDKARLAVAKDFGSSYNNLQNVVQSI